jgi:hypothetical protein
VLTALCSPFLDSFSRHSLRASRLADLGNGRRAKFMASVHPGVRRPGQKIKVLAGRQAAACGAMEWDGGGAGA